MVTAAGIGIGRFYHKLWQLKIAELREHLPDMPYTEVCLVAKNWVLAERDTHVMWSELILKKEPTFEKGVFFLTIRPHDDLRFDKFKDFVCDLFKKRWLARWQYVWEQKGTSYETMGNGAHIHAIINVTSASKGKAYYLNEIIRFVAKKGLSDDIAHNCIDLKQIKSQEDLERRFSYTNTEQFMKADETKEDAWNMDEPWRHKMGLPSLIKSVREGTNQLRIDELLGK